MKQPIKSPIQARMGSPLFLVKLAADLLRVHKDFLAKVDDTADILRETKAERERVTSLPKGDKGDRGPQGFSGINGKDGRDGESPEIDIETVAQAAAKYVPRPKDGVSPKTDDVIKAVVAYLKENDELELGKRFEKVSNEIASYRGQLAGKIYGKDTWARGGGDTVAAGINTTLTRNPDGTVSVNAPGSGGNQVDNEVVAGSGTAWTLAHSPTVGTLRLYANGQRLTPTVDYSITGANITTVLSWLTGSLLADYAY